MTETSDTAAVISMEKEAPISDVQGSGLPDASASEVVAPAAMPGVETQINASTAIHPAEASKPESSSPPPTTPEIDDLLKKTEGGVATSPVRHVQELSRYIRSGGKLDALEPYLATNPKLQEAVKQYTEGQKFLEDTKEATDFFRATLDEGGDANTQVSGTPEDPQITLIQKDKDGKEGKKITLHGVVLVALFVGFDTAVNGGRTTSLIAGTLLNNFSKQSIRGVVEGLGFKVPTEEEENRFSAGVFEVLDPKDLSRVIKENEQKPEHIVNFVMSLPAEDRIKMLSGEKFGGIMGQKHKLTDGERGLIINTLLTTQSTDQLDKMGLPAHQLELIKPPATKAAAPEAAPELPKAA